jgi:hypothetical protein
MISKLMKMKTAFGHHLANRKDRKTKTSILSTVLTAQASVLRYCFFEGYDTQPPEGYDATIALARVTESEALCRRLEKAGFSTTAYAIPNKNTENRHFHPISGLLPFQEVVF